MESFISTMETSALMGMNVAQLVVDDYQQLKDGNEAAGGGEGKGQRVILEKVGAGEL